MRSNGTVIGLLVTQGVAAILGLVVAFGVPPTVEQMAAIMAAAGFVGVVLALALWATTVPRAEVVERLIGTEVVAGEANDIVPNGQHVRALGETAEGGQA